jgi:hypothetical protein
VRDLVYPAVYLLSFGLLFGWASFSLEGDATARRVPPAAPNAALSAASADVPVAARLELERTTYYPGTPDSVRVRVFDADGRPLAARGERTLSLVVVRRDLTEFQPLRAFPDGGGTWSAPLTLNSPGPYRLIAEIRTEAEPLVLGADLTAPGPYRPSSVEAPAARAESWPYAVRMSGTARAGEPSRLAFTLLRGESPGGSDTADLSHAHLTALRLGDLVPARVAWVPDRIDGSTVGVDLACSRAGTYRLFLTFGDERAPHIADFTLPVPA